MATEQHINLTNLIAGAVQVLGHQHPAVLLADAALHYNSTEAHNARAMDEAHRNLQELLDNITAPLPKSVFPGVSGGPTVGEARIGNGEADSDCVVMVGDRQILECYEDGEVQTEVDQANAKHVVKVWNAHRKLVALVKRWRNNEGQDGCCLPVTKFCHCKKCTTVALLRDLGEA